jgi:transposase
VYNRDKEKRPSIVYGLLTDPVGRPVAVDVYAGNTGDPSTVPDQVEKLRTRFGLQRVVLVGDRGMLTDVQITTLKQFPHMGWISALRTTGIQQLVERGDLQLSLFDETNLLEIHSEAYPGERLMVCYNPLLDEKRKRKRASLIAATVEKLNGIVAEVDRRTNKPLLAKEIGLKVGKVLNKYKMGKHVALTIEDNLFTFSLKEDRIEEEARIDGIYIVRTSEAASSLSTEDTVRAYKSLGQVEQAFRCIKGVDILIRPIHHRTEDRVKAHVFLCMLTYYVEWHMKKLLAPVLFTDDELDQLRWTRDPVAKAEPSPSAAKKKGSKTTPDGQPVHSFQTLMKVLGTRCKNVCRVDVKNTSMHFLTKTEPTEYQLYIFNLLGVKCETH